MIHRLLAAAVVWLSACPAAGAAAPDAAAGGTAAPARIFSGCVLGLADANGWGVRCGLEGEAMVSRALEGLPAAKHRQFYLAGLREALGVVITGQRWIPMTLAGRTRQVQEVTFERRLDAPHRHLTSLLASFALSPHHVLDVSCTWRRQLDLDRCTRMMAWMAAHPRTPPQVLRSGPDTTWPSTRDLARIRACRVHSRGLTQIIFECGKARLQVVRADPGRDPEQLRARTRRFGEAAVRRLQKPGKPSTATLDEVPCDLAGARTTCERIRMRLDGHERLTMLKGVGRIFGGLAVVGCFPDVEATGKAKACPPYLSLPGGGAVAPRPPAGHAAAPPR